MHSKNNCHDTPAKDYGPQPFVTDIYKATVQNANYRTALWTGRHLQLTLMCIPICGEIGLEVHPETDQFLRIESGSGTAFMDQYLHHIRAAASSSRHSPINKTHCRYGGTLE